MQKPTSDLIFHIIRYVIENPDIKRKLSGRDNSPDAFAKNIKCEFYKNHSTNKSLSAYKVYFMYCTRYPEELEETDDIVVLVEVKEGSPPTFRILSVKVF